MKRRSFLGMLAFVASIPLGLKPKNPCLDYVPRKYSRLVMMDPHRVLLTCSRSGPVRQGLYKELEASIERHGFLNPILVTDQNIVLDGNRRVIIARKLGMKIPAVKVRLPKDRVITV